MTAAPVGSVVGLTYDADVDVDEGDVLQTGTGRVYRVTRARRQARGRHAGRWHLRALVILAGDVTPDDTVHELRWYSR